MKKDVKEKRQERKRRKEKKRQKEITRRKKRRKKTHNHHSQLWNYETAMPYGRLKNGENTTLLWLPSVAGLLSSLHVSKHKIVGLIKTVFF